MVDPLGSSPLKANGGVGPVPRIAAPPAAPPPLDAPAIAVSGQPAGPATAPAAEQRSGPFAVPASLAATAREFAATAPIDRDHVARIRKAISEGSFPIYPATIADRLIALKLEWHPNEPE